jgi:hypothetical protein
MEANWSEIGRTSQATAVPEGVCDQSRAIGPGTMPALNITTAADAVRKTGRFMCLSP